MKIFINPGHGYGVDAKGKQTFDPGAMGNGLEEHAVALKIGAKTAAYLQKVGYDVKLYQYDGLQAICDAANDYGADLFVSIHCNSAASDLAHGTETFYWNGSVDGERLAQCIHNQIVKSIEITNRGTKTANFKVLRSTNMPAVLVETAFINNKGDARLLVEHEDEFARAIARGVTDYV